MVLYVQRRVHVWLSGCNNGCMVWRFWLYGCMNVWNVCTLVSNRYARTYVYVKVCICICICICGCICGCICERVYTSRCTSSGLLVKRAGCRPSPMPALPDALSRHALPGWSPADIGRVAALLVPTRHQRLLPVRRIAMWRGRQKDDGMERCPEEVAMEPRIDSTDRLILRVLCLHIQPGMTPAAVEHADYQNFSRIIVSCRGRVASLWQHAAALRARG
jgi:hypothetical protein